MAKPVKPKKRIVINPIESTLDIVTDNNFSYESVPTGKRLQIPANMQMIVVEEFDVEGELILDGSLIVEE
jgi:hypothetical protein